MEYPQQEEFEEVSMSLYSYLLTKNYLVVFGFRIRY